MSLRVLASNLGISITTASRALGGFSDVSDATRRRVLEEAARIGYRPNAIARRLRGGNSDAVGVVLPAEPGQLDDPFFLRLIGAIGPALAAVGLDLIVGTARAGVEEENFYRQLVENRRVDAIFLARMRRQDTRVTYLLNAGMPFVIHGRTEEPRPHAHVDVDSSEAFRAAAERLLDFGHRRIAMLNAPQRYSAAYYRALGVQQGMAAAGLAASSILEAEPTEENGYRLAQTLLASAKPPTGLLCATDRLAVGALRAASQAGLRAGRDIAVIGYDNLPVANYTDPPLTTFDSDVEGCAVRMVEMMVALLGGASAAGMVELRPARMIIRASDGPLQKPTHDRPKSRRITEETTHDARRHSP